MREELIKQIEAEWKDERWEGIERPYSAEEVLKLRDQSKLSILWLEEVPKSFGITSKQKIILMLLGR